MEKYTNHPLRGATDLDSAMIMLWSFYKKNFLVLYVISVVAALGSNLITSGMDLASLQSTADPMEIVSLYKKMAPQYLLLIVVSLIFSIILHAYILDKPVSGSYSFLDLLKKSAVALFPYLAAAIAMALAGVFMVAIGLILLIIPGLFAAFYLATVFLFTIPIVLIETRNPGNIISRSLQLAHRNFWPNMGWTAVIVLIVIIAALVISSLSMLPFSGTLIRSLSDPSAALEVAKNPVYIIVASLASALITPVMAIMSFILYFRNRETEAQGGSAKADTEDRVRVEDLYPKMPENKDQAEN